MHHTSSNTPQKRCLFVMQSASQGGAERVLITLANARAALGEHVTVLVLTDAQDRLPELKNSAPALHFRWTGARRERWGVLPLARLVREESEHNIDVTFSTNSHINALLSLLRRLGILRTGLLICRESTRPLDAFYGRARSAVRLAYRRLYGDIDILVLQTEVMSQTLASIGGTAATRSLVIPNPVDLERIDSGLLASSPPQSPTIVACGRLIPLKGFARLLEAFSKASTPSSTTLKIIGEGPQETDLRRLCERLGLQQRVQFVGRSQNPCEHFACATVGVSASDYEGFPNVVLEMMASRVKQLIVTPSTEGLNVLPHVRVLSGWSVDELAQAISEAVASDADFGLRYREHIERSHTAAHFWAAIERVLDETGVGSGQQTTPSLAESPSCSPAQGITPPQVFRMGPARGG